MKKFTWLACLGVLIVLVAGIVAFSVQTAGGKVQIRDVRFVGSNGTVMSALLFVPKSATAKTPAPGILAVHGYINSRETQSGFAIELARRGYVVLEMDQTGHGYSDSPAFANGFGGPDGLAYLRSLDVVDKDNIGMEGHSMGGWTILAAAATMPDSYKSVVLEGSSTGRPYAAEGSTAWPRNLAVVFSTMDEFSVLMWDVPRGKDAPSSPKLQAVFGTTETIEPGKIYGSIEDGTARALYQPVTTHPGDHLSNVAIGYAIDWFAQTLSGGNPIPSSSQIWFWKELMTCAGFVGFVLFMLGIGGLLLSVPIFAPIVKTPPVGKPARRVGLWIGALIATAIPALTFFPFMDWGAKLVKGGAFWPQNITSQLAVWALFNGVISIALFLLWHFILNKKNGARAEDYGLRLSFGDAWRTLLYGFSVIICGVFLLGIADFLFKIDFRFWVLALKFPSPVQVKIALAYAPVFFLFYLVSSLALNGQLKSGGKSVAGRYWFAICTASLGFLVFLLLEYIPLFRGGTLLTASQPLNTIIAIQFLPLMIVTSLFSTWFYEKTGRVYAGALVNALFISWYIVAGQATHFMVR
jgi:pimeloyl-ACP methyl ester carboxylesterase